MLPYSRNRRKPNTSVLIFHGIYLSHLSLDKTAAILPRTFLNAFPWMESFVFWFEFHWRLFPKVQLTISHHWYRKWLGAEQAIIKPLPEPILTQFTDAYMLHYGGDQGWVQIRFFKYKYKYKYKFSDFSNTNTNTNTMKFFFKYKYKYKYEHSNTNTNTNTLRLYSNTNINIQIQIRFFTLYTNINISPNFSKMRRNW